MRVLLQGTLRDQLLYPHDKESRHDDGSDMRLVQLLQEVDLGHLLACKGGLDAVETWQDMLSVGEQQRVSFIRLLYHKYVVGCRAPLGLGTRRALADACCVSRADSCTTQAGVCTDG